jgi:hypothetical protein
MTHLLLRVALAQLPTCPTRRGRSTYSLDPEGAFAGLQLGIDGPGGPFFSGIELDIQPADVKGTSRTDSAPPNIFAFDGAGTAGPQPAIDQ